MKNTEEVILQKSLDLFIEFGIRNVSIDTICNELRISKKTFYSYFKQKEDLVDAILTYEEKINIEEMKKRFDDKNAIESLISVLKEIKKNIDCQPKLMWMDIKNTILKFTKSTKCAGVLLSEKILRRTFNKE